VNNNAKPGAAAPSPNSPPSTWLNPRRIRIQAIILAVCLWGTCAVDFSTHGLFDRAGNIKFQDFLQFYISARQISLGHVEQLFDQDVAAAELQAIVVQPTRVRLPTVYGPQVGLFFVPLARLSFPVAARIWVAISVALFFLCVFLVWRACSSLRAYPGLVTLAALAFPPLFHFFVRGQIAALLVVCFTTAYLALESDHQWWAGVALGCLIFKPQFLIAIPVVLLLARAWRILAGVATGALAQLAFSWIYFGSSEMRAYFEMLWHMPGWIGISEPGAAHIQMHSLRSFWFLLVPWPKAVLALYILSTVVVVGLAAASWKAPGGLPLRFSALVFAAVLANPHLFVYDLLALAPVLLLLANWSLGHISDGSSGRLRVLLYLTFLLPLFGPVALWTHLQLSVLALVAVQWTLWSILRRPEANLNSGSQFASAESGGV
jgi:hypothetical protein